MIEVLITSSVLIAVIVLLRQALRGRIRPGLQYALWGLVLLRLLVPVSWFQSPVSVAGAMEPAIEEVADFSSRPISELPEFFDPAPPEAAVTEPETSFWSEISLKSLAVGIWITGAVLLGLWFALVNFRLAGKLYRERQLYSADHPIAVYVVKSLPSPCLFAGEIYLTEEAAADPARAEYIIAHELTHHRHGDGLWSALRVCCLAVYWFNPFVWLAATLSRRDCEICCDAATVKKLGEEHRFDYGRTLLDMTAVTLRPADLICSATTMSGSGRTLQERIILIAHRPRFSAVLCALVVVIAALTVGFTFSGTTTLAEISALMPQPAATAEPVGEPIGTYDRDYWTEVNDVFGPFLTPVSVETHIADHYKPEEPAFELSFEDLAYSSDSWEFKYFDSSEQLQLANAPDATIVITAQDGRELYVWNDAGIYILEGGYIVTEISLGDADGDEFIAMLLSWAEAWPEEPGAPLPEPEPTAEPTAAPEQNTAAGNAENSSVNFDTDSFEDNFSFVNPWDSTPKPASTPTPEIPDDQISILDSVQSQIESSGTGNTTAKLPTGSGSSIVFPSAPGPASASNLPPLQVATSSNIEEPPEP